MVSESLDRDLPLYQRMAIRMHLFMCRFCTRYRDQMLLLRKAMQLYESRMEEIEPSGGLSGEARERIQKSLEGV